MVGAATEKPLEPKQVRTRGTHSKLVSDERNVAYELECNVQEQSSLLHHLTATTHANAADLIGRMTVFVCSTQAPNSENCRP